jgi:hypothetical protein
MLRFVTRHGPLLAALLIAGLLPADALAERIRCASRDYRYAFCRTGGRVLRARVIDRHSKRPCTFNRTWGWRGDGVWVDNGCDADFDVELSGGGSFPGPGPGPGPGPYPPPRPPVQDTPPSWAIGRWRSGGFALDISRNGSVQLERRSGYWYGSSIVLNDGERLRVDRDRRNRLTIYWPNGRNQTFLRY